MHILFPREHLHGMDYLSENKYTPMQVALATRKKKIILPLLIAGMNFASTGLIIDFQCYPHIDEEVVPNWKKKYSHFLKRMRKFYLKEVFNFIEATAGLFIHARTGNVAELSSILDSAKRLKIDVNSFDL